MPTIHSSLVFRGAFSALATAALVAAQTPITAELDAIAQAQLKKRAAVINAINDPESARQRQMYVRETVLRLIGGLPEHKGPLNAEVTRVIERDGFLIENVVFESLPDYFVTANLYRPAAAGKHPAVLMSMGHWDSGKAAGQLIASNLARKGFVVLAYDPVGQGERQQAYDPETGKSRIGGPTEQHFMNGAQAVLLGQSVARYFIHDGMRAIDYLVSRPDVDRDRIGATGCSGGGTQTTYIAALDPRVKVAAPACYMNSFQTLFTGSVGDSEQSLPGFLAAGLDQTDYVELFAPKPWLILSTENDFFTPAGARQVYDEAHRWYTMLGVPDRVNWVVGPGEHGTPQLVREAIYEWMIRWLREGEGNAHEEDIPLLDESELLVTSRGVVGGRQLYEVIRETPRTPGTEAELKAFTKALLAANPPLSPNFRVLPGSAADGDEKSPAVVLVQDTLTPGPDAQALLDNGNIVVLVQPSGIGTPDKQKRHSGNWLNNTRAWLVGRNLPATHASEINAAVMAALERPYVDRNRISARAAGVAGVWLMLAAAVNPAIHHVTLHDVPASLKPALDSPIHMNLHDAVIPGFALKWDLSDLRKLVREEP